MTSVLTPNQLQTLSANFKGTSWSNPRYENGILIATHQGKFVQSLPNGYMNVYNGEKECKIFPAKTLLNTEHNYGFDQNGFVNKEMDSCIF